MCYLEVRAPEFRLGRFSSRLDHPKLLKDRDLQGQNSQDCASLGDVFPSAGFSLGALVFYIRIYTSIHTNSKPAVISMKLEVPSPQAPTAVHLLDCIHCDLCRFQHHISVGSVASFCPDARDCSSLAALRFVRCGWPEQGVRVLGGSAIEPKSMERSCFTGRSIMALAFCFFGVALSLSLSFSLLVFFCYLSLSLSLPPSLSLCVPLPLPIYQ